MEETKPEKLLKNESHGAGPNESADTHSNESADPGSDQSEHTSSDAAVVRTFPAS